MPRLLIIARGWLALCFASLSLPSGAQGWETVAADTYKLLWKEITYTQLQVDPAQPLPATGEILDPAYAKQIVIRYGLAVSAQRFRSLTQDSLEGAFSEQELAPYRGAIGEFNNWYLDVEKGDQYRLSWLPGEGLSLFYNERRLGTLQDPGAAQIILSVWLGRAAVSEDQRDAFLARWRQSSADQ